tara:strand:+ start:4624 stop:5802 length:1179 start_codon:yes stop_codon:yes gene_type:complete
MSIFTNRKTSADRSATDRSRHKKKIEKAIREGVYNIVADESIIGKDGKKKIKIPVKGIKEYRLIHGNNESNKKVGSAPGKNVKRGQVLQKKKPQKKPGEGNKPGNDPGEEFYEVEITLEELASYLFDNLKLPDLEKKTMKNIVSEKYKRSGYRKAGIRPRLSKKKTLINKIKRKAQKKRVLKNNPESDDERFTFHNNDLAYRHIKSKPKERDNAVIFFIMDVSGSMTQSKKFIARSFFFLLYHFIKYRYDKVEIVFISHTTEAKEVREDEFFTRVSSGGTYLSSGLEKCAEIINDRYHKSAWNIYAFHGSDGDNWPDDIEKSLSMIKTISDIAQLFCFIEIIPEKNPNMWIDGTMAAKIRPLESKKTKIVTIGSPSSIWPEFVRIFGAPSAS